MESLLSQFYSRIKGSQEDIASEGLAYILQRSKGARNAINNIIENACGLNLPELNYLTQNVGEKLERPDISGFSDSGKEFVILEAKFWAALTSNQPAEYLNRQKNESVLVFICPSLRVRTIYDEIARKLNLEKITFVSKTEELLVLPEKKQYILIKTWESLLNAVKFQLTQENNYTLISDIDQIICFCNVIDRESFMPIQNDDLSPKLAKRINSYYDLLDKVVDELKKRDVMDVKNLKATPQKYGYTRYGKILKYGVAINARFDLWERYADTPFWFSVKDDSVNAWKITDKFKYESKKIAKQLGYSVFENNNQEPFFALYPLLNQTEELVINSMANQIMELI